MDERIERSPQTDAGRCLTFSMYATPAAVFSHPREVLNDDGLTSAEKRAILASWVSDARAVENAPELRQLEGGAVVRLDEVMQALRDLDSGRSALGPSRLPAWHMRVARRRRAPLAYWLGRRTDRNRHDDDDDPPPCPAGVGRPFRPTLQGGMAALPVCA